MLDAHIHLDFIANAEEVAREAVRAGGRYYACTVTPSGFERARERFAAFENAEVGLGLHPWWIAGNADGPADALDAATAADELIAHLGEASLVGEVGLDFGKRHAATHDQQLAAFERIAYACAQQGGKTLSVHSVHAAREALDVLEATGAFTTCTCIFHWYSGPSDQLKRAIDAGAFFSVGQRMLATRKGREYVKAIPAARILLETDAPAQRGQTCSFSELHDELQRTAQEIAAIKDLPAADLAAMRFFNRNR